MQSYQAKIDIHDTSERVLHQLSLALVEAGACVDYAGGRSGIINAFVPAPVGCDDVYCRLRSLAGGTIELRMLVTGSTPEASAKAALERRKRLVALVFAMLRHDAAARPASRVA